MLPNLIVMVGLDNYLVEIDLEWYHTMMMDDNRFISPTRAGMLGDKEPKHGTVVATIEGSKVKTGDTLFFVHYNLYDKEKRDGKYYVSVPEHLALGYCKNFPKTYSLNGMSGIDIRGLHFLPATKVINPAWEENQKATIKNHNIPKHLPRVYKAVESGLNIRKGDVVWTHGGSEYFVQYIPDTVFLDRDWITYNETKDQTLNDYCILKVDKIGKATRLIDYEGSKKRPQGTGIVLKKRKNLNKGDYVRWDISLNQISPRFKDVFTPKYHDIVSKIVIDNT